MLILQYITGEVRDKAGRILQCPNPRMALVHGMPVLQIETERECQNMLTLTHYIHLLYITDNTSMYYYLLKIILFKNSQ